jgi:hypothetical protein
MPNVGDDSAVASLSTSYAAAVDMSHPRDRPASAPADVHESVLYSRTSAAPVRRRKPAAIAMRSASASLPPEVAA